jgi:serine/threonine protein kinase
MSIAFDLYERIMDSIQLLIKFKIVHYDLKENNILVEKIQQLPYIIDFGLSIDIDRLLQHQWSDKDEEKLKSSTTTSKTRLTIDSNVLYSSDSSKILKNNYLWKQHFYVHAPDYFLWPIEVHLMTYLINEHDTLTEESLRKICFEYVSHNRAIEYTSRDFKRKMFDLSIHTFSRFIHQPREKVLNELLKYWDKWDMYAINIMFLKIMYELIFHRDIISHDTRSEHLDTETAIETHTDTETDDASSQSLNEDRQKKLDPHYSHDTKIEFKSRYKIKLKQKYNSYKIMNAIQVMLRNIHPNPDKRMTPEETKTFFVSIFYEC